MSKIIKALLMPFVRILEGTLVVLCAVCIAAVIVGLLYIEYCFWWWDWPTAIGIHLAIAYAISVLWSYEKNADWWWWPGE